MISVLLSKYYKKNIMEKGSKMQHSPLLMPGSNDSQTAHCIDRHVNTFFKMGSSVGYKRNGINRSFVIISNDTHRVSNFVPYLQ